MILTETEQEIREGKLRKDILQTLQNNKRGDVVDDIIKLIKKDYILLIREPLYCRDCVSCNDNTSNGRFFTTVPYYCKHYQRTVNYGDEANNCPHYLGGKEEARKSLARTFAHEGDLFYE